jgi:hypothetical protein
LESASIPLSLGAHLDQVLDDARSDWLATNKAGLDEESAWTLEVVETSLSLQLKHGGRASVQVTIISRRPWLSEVSFYKLRQRGPRDWIRVGDSLR